MIRILPGQYFDKETNLHYNYFRDYDPGIGRYVQSDPIGLDGGINTYAYVRNRPIDKFDPRGLVEWEGSATGGMFLTGGLYTFNLRTKCIDGKQGEATVILAGSGIGAGLIDFSFTSSDVKLRDSLSHIDPNIFNDPSLDGGFMATIGLSIGEHGSRGKRIGRMIAGRDPNPPPGGGCAAIRLGNAGGAGCGSSRGLELGGGILFGSSTLISGTVGPCKCESKK